MEHAFSNSMKKNLNLCPKAYIFKIAPRKIAPNKFPHGLRLGEEAIFRGVIFRVYFKSYLFVAKM